MFANLLKYFLGKLIYWEQKDNFEGIIADWSSTQ